MTEESGSRGEDGWLADELSNSTLPDLRLIHRLKRIVDHLAASPGQPVPAACRDWAATKAAYRFFDNDRVTEQGVLAGHFAATRERFAATTGTVLILQDTTEFIYKRDKPEKVGFTKAINSGRDREGRLREHTLCGLLMHSSLAVTTDGVPLGLAAVKFWTRSKFKGTAALKRKVNPTRVPIETKESYRWLENLRQSSALFENPRRCVHVGDRESDIYELFCLAHNLGTFFLVRVQTDRLTQLPEDVTDDALRGKVYQRLEAMPWAGHHTIQIGGETAQPSAVSLKVKFSEIDTMPPIGKQKAYKPQRLVYIHAMEEGEPEGRPRIDWRLVTNLPVTTLAEAIEKLSWYARRWKIEVFHKVMKSGCKAEDAKLRTAERLVKLLAVIAVVSWRVFWITMSARANPEAPPETALTPAEISILGLAKHLNDFIREACKILNCSLVVLPIDDVDMAPRWSYGILEVIRRHLAHPQIVPVVTGDLRQYSHIIFRKFERQLQRARGDEYPMLDDLRDQYLNKVLPVHRRVRLLTVPEVMERYYIIVRRGGDELSLEFINFFFKHLIYRGTNGTEQSHPPFLPENARDLIQWLQATAPLILSIKKMKDIGESASGTETALQTELRACTISRDMRGTFDSEERNLLVRILRSINVYWENTGRWPDYYRGEADIYLTAFINNDNPSRRLSDFVWFNVLLHPKDNSHYNWHQTVVEALSEADNLFPPGYKFRNTLVAFPPLEPYSRDVIFSKDRIKAIRSPECHFLATVFCYDNYYSSYQTTNLIFFGRAFEIIVTSLIGSGNLKTFSRIMRDPPFHSYFSVFSTRTLGAEIGEADKDTTSGEARDHSPFLLQFTEEVEKWYHSHGASRPSAQLIQKAMNKAFTMFVQLKLKGGRRLARDSLFTVAGRFGRIMLNAFGSFEKSVLDGDGIVVSQNVALESLKDSKLPEWESDASYRFNVAPLLKPGTVTYAISTHPLFDLMKNDESSSLIVSSTRKRMGVGNVALKLTYPPASEFPDDQSISRYCEEYWKIFVSLWKVELNSMKTDANITLDRINGLTAEIRKAVRSELSHQLLSTLKTKRRVTYGNLKKLFIDDPSIMTWLTT